MGVNYTPEPNPYFEMNPFRFWCQKVLPLAYDDALSYYEVLCKLSTSPFSPSDRKSVV